MRSYSFGLFCSVLMTSALLVTPVYAEPAAKDVDQQDVQADWSAAVESLKSYSVGQRDAAVEKAGETLADMDRSIEELEQRTAEEWAGLSDEARVARRKAIRELTARRNELAEWYGGMKYSSAQAWGEMQKGFAEAYKILQESWEDALEEFD
jgi:hypothetical protein